jgi:hypothetical protein
MDWRAHFDAIYAKLGVAATLDLGTDGEAPLTVIDKTSGVVVESGSVGVATIKPACSVRTHELADLGIVNSQLRRSFIDFNGRSWRVESFIDRPSPGGLDVGEVMLILTEAAGGSA